MLTTENTGALIGRVKYDGTQYEVVLTRDIMVNGKPHKVGDIVKIGGSDLKTVLGMKMGILAEKKETPKKKDKE